MKDQTFIVFGVTPGVLGPWRAPHGSCPTSGKEQTEKLFLGLPKEDFPNCLNTTACGKRKMCSWSRVSTGPRTNLGRGGSWDLQKFEEFLRVTWG